MTISVIIPTKNRLKDLLNTMETVLMQRRLPDEIIIVDQNRSTDIKASVMSLYNASDSNNDIIMKYIHDPEITGLTQARNRGISHNESDIVLFLDDDVLMEKDFIFNIMEIYRKYPDIYGVSGIITNSNRGLIGNILNKIFMIGNFTDKRILVGADRKYRDCDYVEVPTLPGGLTSYKREIFRDFTFDENFIEYGLSEDFDFSFRVSRKYKIVITPSARLEHVCTGSIRTSEEKVYENLIVSLNYFFRKNLKKNVYNYFCYIWLLFGYFLYSILLFIVRRKSDVFTGYMKGLWKLISGGRSDFIRIHD